MTSARLKNFGKINRDKAISFTWDNKKYFGYEGDTLASALLANDIKIIGKGETSLLVNTDDEVSHPANRRVEISSIN